MKRNGIRRRYKDPVCGMIISRSAAAAEWAFGGKVYCFCSSVCCEAFKANPQKFLHKRARRRSGSRCRQHQHQQLGLTCR